ncbi:hypothetical protein LBMAG03_13690 [Actinomycetes bacterium]|nr:hypothetical protein LBMAG03_13690 [Actinomycetes bacterium]
MFPISWLSKSILNRLQDCEVENLSAKTVSNDQTQAWAMVKEIVTPVGSEMSYQVINQARLYEWIVRTNSNYCLRTKRFSGLNYPLQDILI